MPAKAEATSIPCTTPQALQAELDSLTTILSLKENEDNWEKLEKALIRFTAVTRGGGYKHLPLFTDGLGRKDNGPAIISAMLSERGRLSAAATDLVQTFAPRLSLNFGPLVPIYVDALMKLLARPNKVIYKRTEKCLTTIIGNCLLPSIVNELKKGLTDEAPTMRRGCSAGIEKALKEWNSEIWGEKGLVVLEENIKKIAKDKDPEVRQTGKRVWALYSETWPERVEEFSAPLTPTTRRYLDIANPGVPGKTKSTAASRPIPSALSSKNLSSQATSTRPPTQRVPSNPAKTRPQPGSEAGPSQPRSRPPSPRRAHVTVTTAAAVPLPESPPSRPISVKPRLVDAPAVPPIPAKYSRSVSHQILPTAGLQRSPSSFDALQAARPFRPVRPPLPPSFSTVSLSGSQSGEVEATAATAAVTSVPAPPRRFAPPVRIPRQVPTVEEDAEEQYATPLNPSILRGPSRPANAGPGKRTMLGQAQRRVVTAPGPNAEYILVDTTTPALPLGRSLGKGIKDKVDQLEKASSPPRDGAQTVSRPESAQTSPSRPLVASSSTSGRIPILDPDSGSSPNLPNTQTAEQDEAEELLASRSPPRPASAIGVRREDIKVVSPLRVPLARTEAHISPMFPVSRRIWVEEKPREPLGVKERDEGMKDEEEEEEEMLQDVTVGQMADLTMLEDSTAANVTAEPVLIAVYDESGCGPEEPILTEQDVATEFQVPSVRVQSAHGETTELEPATSDTKATTSAAAFVAAESSNRAAPAIEEGARLVASPIGGLVGVAAIPSEMTPSEDSLSATPATIEANSKDASAETHATTLAALTTAITAVPAAQDAPPMPAESDLAPLTLSRTTAPVAPRAKSTLSTSTSRAPLAAIKAKPPLVPTKSTPAGSIATVPTSSVVKAAAPTKVLPKVELSRKPAVPKARAASERRPFKPTSSGALSASKGNEAQGKTRTVSGPAIDTKVDTGGNNLADGVLDEGETTAIGGTLLAGEANTNISNAAPTSAPLPKANTKPAPALPSTVSRSGNTVVSSGSGSAPPARVPSSRAVSANSAQAKSTVTLPPVKRDRVKRKASLPKFKPVKRAGVAMGAGSGTTVSSQVPAGAGTLSKSIIAKVKPEMVALPPSPGPGDRPLSRAAGFLPSEIPLPGSPARPDSKVSVRSSASVSQTQARARSQTEQHGLNPLPSMGTAHASVTATHTTSETASARTTTSSPLPSSKRSNGTAVNGKSGSPISVGIGRPLSPLLTTGPAELPSPPPGSPITASVASPRPGPRSATAVHIRAHTDNIGNLSPQSASANVQLIDHPAINHGRPPRVPTVPSSMSKSDRPRVNTAMSLYAATEAGDPVDSSDDDESDEEDTSAGVQFQTQPRENRRGQAVLTRSTRAKVRNLANVHQSPMGHMTSAFPARSRQDGMIPHDEPDLIQFSAPSRPAPAPAFAPVPGPAGAPAIITHHASTPIKVRVQPHPLSGIKTQLSTPNQHSRDVLLKLAGGGQMAGSTTPLDSPRRILVVRDANLTVGERGRARVLAAGAGSVSGSDMEDEN